MFNPNKSYRTPLFLLAAIGFIVPNGVFLFFAFTQPEKLREAFANPISLTFMAEAFYLLGIFAWLLYRQKERRPGWAAFIVLSLLGSLAFSVPLFLAWSTHESDTNPES